MDDLIGRMKAEEAALVRKLEAVRAFILAYADEAPVLPKTALADAAEPKRSGPRTSDYAKEILAAAAGAIHGQSSPVPTREIVAALEAHGIELRGQDKSNALSALLSRNERFKSNGRAGWTLTGGGLTRNMGTLVPNENEAPNGSDTVGASDAEEVGPSSEMNLSLVTGTRPERLNLPEGGSYQ